MLNSGFISHQWWFGVKKFAEGTFFPNCDFGVYSTKKNI